MSSVSRVCLVFLTVALVQGCLGLPTELISTDEKAARARVVGVVTDGSFPLPGASVALDCGADPLAATSDRDGRFEFSDLPQPAECLLTIELVGYESYSSTLRIPPTLYRLRVELQAIAGSTGSDAGHVEDDGGQVPAGDDDLAATTEPVLLERQIFGQATDLDGQPLGGGTVALQFLADDGAWNVAVSAPISVSGTWMLPSAAAVSGTAARLVLSHRQRSEIFAPVDFALMPNGESWVFHNHAPTIGCVGDTTYGAVVTVTVDAGSGARWNLDPVDADGDLLAATATATSGLAAIDAAQVLYQAPALPGTDIIDVVIDDGSRTAACRFDVNIVDAEGASGRR